MSNIECRRATFEILRFLVRYSTFNLQLFAKTCLSLSLSRNALQFLFSGQQFIDLQFLQGLRRGTTGGRIKAQESVVHACQ